LNLERYSAKKSGNKLKNFQKTKEFRFNSQNRFNLKNFTNFSALFVFQLCLRPENNLFNLHFLERRVTRHSKLDRGKTQPSTECNKGIPTCENIFQQKIKSQNLGSK